jgi:hypothetical protein
MPVVKYLEHYYQAVGWQMPRQKVVLEHIFLLLMFLLLLLFFFYEYIKLKQ